MENYMSRCRLTSRVGTSCVSKGHDIAFVAFMSGGRGVLRTGACSSRVSIRISLAKPRCLFSFSRPSPRRAPNEWREAAKRLIRRKRWIPGWMSTAYTCLSFCAPRASYWRFSPKVVLRLPLSESECDLCKTLDLEATDFQRRGL